MNCVQLLGSCYLIYAEMVGAEAFEQIPNEPLRQWFAWRPMSDGAITSNVTQDPADPDNNNNTADGLKSKGNSRARALNARFRSRPQP